MSLKTPRIPPFFFGFASSAMGVSVSESVQVVLVLFPELLALRHVPLPRRDLRHDVREQPERVDWRQHRDADQVTERHDHEDRLQLMAHLQRVTGELVPRQAVHELRERAAQARPPLGQHPSILQKRRVGGGVPPPARDVGAEGLRPAPPPASAAEPRSEEHTSELQSQSNLVCRLLLEKKKTNEQQTASVASELVFDDPVNRNYVRPL